MEQLRCHLIRHVLGPQHVSVGNEQVYGTVLVVVKGHGSETERSVTGRRDTSPTAVVMEHQVAKVVV